MPSVAVRGTAAARTWSFPTAAVVALGLAALLAVSVFLRTREITASFWIDEGLSVGIASHPLAEIPTVLRQDGSPPLYYVLLHLWMDVLGRGEVATHALSLLFALLTVPAALWAGWSLFGRRAGWVAAALAALNPFLTIHAQETRMYTLVALLTLLATATFLHAFVFGRRRYLPAFAVTLALLLYTHNWGLFFAAAAALALVPCLLEFVNRRRIVLDGLLAFGAAGVLFAPWLATLAFQAAHTGAPWSKPPSFVHLLGGISLVVSGDGSAVALLLAGGVGLGRILNRRGHRERVAVLAGVVLAVGTLGLAWMFSQLSPAWALRYLAVLVGPLLVLAAAGLARARRLGVAGLLLVLLFWAVYPVPDVKSNVEDVAAEMSGVLKPGDLVVSTQPEQVPVLHYYLPPDLRYATPIGPVTNPLVMDWRNAVARLEAARVETRLEPLLARLPVGKRVLLVRPIVENSESWSAPWTRLVWLRSTQWTRALTGDERFIRTAVAPLSYAELPARSVQAVLYTKVETGEAAPAPAAAVQPLTEVGR